MVRTHARQIINVSLKRPWIHCFSGHFIQFFA